MLERSSWIASKSSRLAVRLRQRFCSFVDSIGGADQSLLEGIEARSAQGFVRFLLGFDHRKLGLQLLVVLEQKLVALGVHRSLGGQLLAHFQADGVLGVRDDVGDQGACRQCDLHVAQRSEEVRMREF